MNPRLNIGELVQNFPGHVLNTHGKPVYNLESPFEVALRENQLRVVQAEFDLGPAIPAHYFVYALGESPSREQSRIGGLPYRPRGLKWPCDADGKPKEFVCQVDFSNSQSLLPRLPGDILLIFVSEEASAENPITLEWHPAGLTDLIRAVDLPKFNFTFPMVHETVHCYLYETHDYPDATSRLQGTKFEGWKTLGLPCGCKIGGYEESCRNGSTHVFTLESIRLGTNDPYPFVNLKGWKADSIRDRLASQLLLIARKLSLAPPRPRVFDVLMIGDLGRICIFNTTSGQFEAVSTCY